MIFMKKLTTRLLSLVLLGAFIPSFVLADTWDLGNGNITVSATETSQTVTQGGGTPTVDYNPVITSNGPTSNTVTINAGENATANVTLENVNIDVGSKYEAAITTSGEGNVNIELNGTNRVQSGSYHAGVEKTNGGTLTITDANQDNGSLTATGGNRGAGIGGGDQDSGSDITISGGEVKANGGYGGAGIGGGSGDNGSDITVSGGTVTANGGYGSAGIGGGLGGDGTDIKVSGDEVLAQGGDNGAGIGGGSGGDGTGIKVSGGEVKATGGSNGAGIGGGAQGAGTGITVSGGNVTANGGKSGAGIGGGTRGAGKTITIENGAVTATGGMTGAGIGGGYYDSGTGITVSNDAQVKVQGGKEWNDVGIGTGAGIGNGGKPSENGAELPQKPDKLNEGTIRYYAPGANMQTDAPTESLYNPDGEHNWNGGTVTTPATCTTPGVKTYTCQTDSAHTKTEELPALGHLFETYVYNNDATTEADGTETARCAHPGCTVTDTRTAKGSKLTGNTAETAVEARQEAYWVSGADGRSLSYQSQVKDGVLTVTVQADTASLRGTTGSLRQLEAQGITGIRFVTKRAQSDFTLSDLLTSGTGSFTLTHDGETVTFTLAEKDISGILK